MLERGNKVFAYFLDVRKAFDTVWIEGLLYKIFSELGIKGRMWLAIKDLYTDVKAQVLCQGVLTRKFSVSQWTRQGRIFAPFMYKVYINSLLCELSDHCFSMSIYGHRLLSPSFADDISLLALHLSFLQAFMNICFDYGVRWRYECNNSKSGIVTFGETKAQHFISMNKRSWVLGSETVEELYEYKNLGVLKNYVGSFSSNVIDNIEKLRKKVGMLFSDSFDWRKVNPFVYVYIKFWRQACLPSLLFGSELFTVTPNLLHKLEHCQIWFLKIIFFAPKFVPNLLILQLAGLNSIESEIDIRKLLFLGRLLTEPKMIFVVKSLFQSRAASYFDPNIKSIGVLPSICDTLCKYNLFTYFETWFYNSIFPCYEEWKSIVYHEVRNSEMNKWTEYCVSHPNLHVAKACIDNIPPQHIWSLTNQYPNLVRHLHVQVRLMGNFGLNTGVPWLSDMDGQKCFISKNGVEDAGHFFFDGMSFRENYTIIWSNLKTTLFNANPLESKSMFSFLVNLDRKHKTMFLLGGLSLPFDSITTTIVKRFVSTAVGKIYKIRSNKLRDLEAPWLKVK